MRFETYLTEKSFELQDVPRTFRVVMDLDWKDPEKTLKELSNMKLAGITGISDKHDIAFQWLGVARDIMLIMKGTEMLKLNKISRILYDNPHYMLSNNMAASYRIFQKSESSTHGLMFNLFEYYMNALVKNKILTRYDLEYSAPYQTLAHNIKQIPPKINGVKDWIKYFRKTLKFSADAQEDKDWPDRAIIDIEERIKNTSDAILTKSVFDMYKAIAGVYGDEGEWIIKDRTLKIPKGSYLYILVDRKGYMKYQKMKKEEPQQFKIATRMGFGGTDVLEKYQKIENGVKTYLKGKYVTKLIDQNQWKKVQSEHLSKK